MSEDALPAALGDAVRGAIVDAVADEDYWCELLDGDLSRDDDPDWSAEEMLGWRLLAAHAARGLVVAHIEAEFGLAHPREDFTGRTCTMELVVFVMSDGSDWSGRMITRRNDPRSS